MSSSYPSSFRFEAAIGTLTLSSFFPLSGGFMVAPVRNVCSLAYNKRGSVGNNRNFLFILAYNHATYGNNFCFTRKKAKMSSY